MKLSQLVLLIILAAYLPGCSTFAVEGRYSYDSATDHSALKSFALLTVDDSTFSTPEGTAHYRSAMVDALSAKGFTEDPENPDFLIETIPVATYREEYVSLYGKIDFSKSRLRVNFLNPSPGAHHVFEGVAEAFYEASWSQKEKNLVIDKAIEVLLRGFPPGPK